MRLALLAAASALVVSACNPVMRSHGYVPNENLPQDIEAGTDDKASVMERLGNPSTTGVFETDTWYYISSTREELAYFKPKTRSRRIVAIEFDDGGTVSNVEEYDLADGRNVNLVGRETPTRGRELTILEQLFGNIGRLPTEQLGGDRNLPGGAGGPRPDGS
ncbi:MULTISPECIES: outer membrane protein assembly factor BamE [Euryhalocaulis]|uniref:outer membrane protein assembly factor BamE n=1 Tax=Euryhalocaulis TaxID=1712422 RepID=UPI00039CB5A2|nr:MULTISPECIES: outer membrane protein assembly factor BamE [Euryhalocaulis]MBA4802080.1 outer membrane protein assembly factor BamE [Euryhalocaulis sp.]